MQPHLVSAASARFVFASAIACAMGGAPPPVAAQVVTPKTVPVQQGQQFDIVPSSTAGMAGVSLALDDTVADAFVNPAKATRVRTGRLFTAPFCHKISDRRGGGCAFPIGGVASSGRWSAAGVYALQQLDRSGPMADAPAISERTASNRYLALSLARQMGRGVSVGASGHFAGLGAVDGVDLLYAGSDRIVQSGSSADMRLGILKEFSPGRSLELLVVHNQYRATHDVHYTDVRFDHGFRQVVGERTQRNDDRTYISGAHVAYARPLGAEGWRLGWVATMSKLTHPKIPEYDLRGFRPIPRDPGHTLGYHAGVGLSRTVARTTLGLDLLLEPMSTETWADAARDTAVAGGGIIPAGGKTIENSFRFSNTIMRAGFAHEWPERANGTALGVQFGLGLYAINYQLAQENNVQRTFRTQQEHWMEWTPTFGFSLRGKMAEFRYNLTKTCVREVCIPIPVPFGQGDKVTVQEYVPPSVVAAPSEPLTFDGGTARTHKFSLHILIR